MNNDKNTMTDEKFYKALQRRLDRYPVGAPSTGTMMEILGLCFSPREAAIAAKMPVRPRTLDALAKTMSMDPGELGAILDEMAFKGLVMDIRFRDEVRYILSPTVTGFFEFTFMRAGSDHPNRRLANKRLAELLERVMFEEPDFMKRAFPAGSSTPLGRALVHESALDEADRSEVVDYNAATAILKEAKSLGVGVCYCRKKEEHLGKACDAPQDVCLSMGKSVDYLVRRKLAREISTSEALDIVEKCREAGLVHIVDNVQNRPSFMCNCCGCCCCMLKGLTSWGLDSALASSGYVASVNTGDADEEDAGKCVGCGKCAKACPANALSLSGGKEAGNKKPQASVDRKICIGCGVCVSACQTGAIAMTACEKRFHTPENTMERVVRMSLERGTFQHLIFDDPNKWTHKTGAALLGALLSLPPSQKLLAVEAVRSKFISAFMARR